MASAGTLTMTVEARTGALEKNLRYAGDLVNRFATKTQRAIEQLNRSSQMLAHGFGGTDVLMGGMSRAADSAKAAAETTGVALERAAERGRVGVAGLSRSIGTAAGGLLMLAGSAEGAANTIGGALTRAAGAFIAGGPLVAGVSLIADGIAAIGRNAESSTPKLSALDAAMRRMASASERIGAARSMVSADAARERAGKAGRTSEQQSAVEGAEASLAAKRSVVEAAIRDEEKISRRLAELRKDEEEWNKMGLPAPNAQQKEKATLEKSLTEQRAIRMAAANSVAEDERTLRVLLDDIAKQAIDKREEREAAHQERLEQIRREGARLLEDGERTLTARQEKLDEERYQLSEDGRRRAFDRANQLRERIDREQKQSASKRGDVAAANRAESERLSILRASTDLERLQAQHRADFRREVERGVDPSMVLRRHAEETRQLLEEQAEQANRVAEATQRAADAEAEAAESVKRRAEAERRATDEQKRASTLSQYAGGYGPNAQARDAKAANRRLRKNLRHEANLKAEAASRFGPTVEDDGMDLWRTREQPSSEYYQKWGLDASGQPVMRGWDLRHREKFMSPGGGVPPPGSPTPSPTPEDIYGPGGLGALGDAAGKLGAAGDTAKAAGEALSGASEEMKSAAGEITEGADRTSKAAADVATNVAAIGTGVLTMADRIESISEDLDNLKQQLTTAGYIAA